MFSRALAVGTALLAVVPVPTSAQDSLQVLAAMEARLDSLRRAVAREDSAASQAVQADTVRAGGLVVVTSAALRPLASSAAAEAWDTLVHRFGAEPLARVALPVIPFGGGSDAGRAVPDVHQVADGFTRMVAGAVWRRQDAALTGWLHFAFPVGAPDREEAALLATRIAVWPARPNLRCLAGDTDACATALGLGIESDTVDAWYAPEALPSLVALPGFAASPPGYDSLRERCFAGSLAACREFLDHAAVSPPVRLSGRTRLARIALEMGGAGAFARLTADSTLPMASRLEAAAGSPLAVVLQTWLAEVEAASPGSPLPGTREALGGLTTCVIVLLLGLRGPRWS